MIHRWTLAVLTVLIPALATAQEQRAIPVLTGDWPPYVAEADPQHGILSELVRLALVESGYRPSFEFTNFSIAKRQAAARGALTFPWFTTEADTAEWFIGKEPLFEIEYVFFYNKQNQSRQSENKTLRDDVVEFKALEDLFRYRIGGVAGYNYRPAIEKHIAASGQRSADEFIAFRQLINGDFDFLPASRNVGEHLLDLYFAESRYKIGQLSAFTVTRPIYLLASRSRPENEALVARLDAALVRLKQNGALSRIEAHYNARRKYDQVVRLRGSDKFPIVTGFQTEQDVEGYLIPNGTRAIVVDWGKGFLQTGPVDVPRQMFTKSRVRLLDGPLKGHELYVNSLYITFE